MPHNYCSEIAVCSKVLRKMMLLLITVLFVLQCTALALERQWCPPIMFQSNKKQQINKYRTAVLTDIHGQLVRTGLDWGTFVDGDRLSRFLYHHIGILGFDRVYITVMYNATIHVTPPTMEELYPSDKSCVVDWSHASTIIWKPYPYAGPKENWAVEPGTNTKSLRKDLWKPVRGLNPVFNAIRASKETDWVYVTDVDELLTPMNFHPPNHDWCYSKYPSLINQALDQMMTVAAKKRLQSDKEMWEQRSLNQSATVCDYGMSINKDSLHCEHINAFTFPAYLWTNPVKEAKRTDVMPLLRTKASTAYDYDIIRRFNDSESDRIDDPYKEWKSIHQIAHSPEFDGCNTMHHNRGFNVMAPRKYHNVVSFEVAHVKTFCIDECEKYLKRDNRLHGLMMSYNKCMALLAK